MKWKQDLLKDIRFNDHRDDADNGYIKRETPHSSWPHEEFTDCNRNALRKKFLSIKDRCRAILEIGVARNKENSSSFVFINNKLPETKYIGIDIENKNFLDNPSQNVFTIKNDSRKIEENMDKINALGIREFDFIFIDGFHSVNHVLTEWEYTKWLSKDGIVGFHDTAEHPGPFLFIRNIDTQKWNVEVNSCPNDWGIGFAWSK